MWNKCKKCGIFVDNNSRCGQNAANVLLAAGIREVKGTFAEGEPVEIIGPDGQMRGPGMRSLSMPRFSPKTGPPRSRTLVKPRISISCAAFVAATFR